MSMMTPKEDTPLSNEVKISPEDLSIAKVYLATMDIHETADNLGLCASDVSKSLRKKGVSEFINNVMSSYAIKNASNISQTLDGLIETKMEELAEAEATSSKDIADLLALRHKFAKEEFTMAMKLAEMQKEQTNIKQNNTQINLGDNWASLMQKLVK